MQPGTGKQSVVIMPESEGNVLCIRHSGLITSEDHTAYLTNQFPGLIQEYGTVNVLIFYDDDYKGYTPEAADSSIRSMLDYGRFVRKLAYVNPPETRIMLHKILHEVITGEVRFFNKESLADALQWIKS